MLSGEINRDFIEAVSDGVLDRVQSLLTAGVNPDTTDEGGNPALLLAVAYGHTEVVQVLLSVGANPNKTDKVCGRTPLLFAIHGKSAAMVDLLLTAGANPNQAEHSQNGTPLLLALWVKHRVMMAEPDTMSDIDTIIERLCAADGIDTKSYLAWEAELAFIETLKTSGFAMAFAALQAAAGEARFDLFSSPALTMLKHHADIDQVLATLALLIQSDSYIGIMFRELSAEISREFLKAHPDKINALAIKWMFDSSCTHLGIPYLDRLQREVAPELQRQIIALSFEYALAHLNIHLLHWCVVQPVCAESIAALSALDHKKMTDLLAIVPAAENAALVDLMPQFVHFGDMTLQGAQLTCAQIQARKTYPFDPLIIEQSERAQAIQYIAHKGAELVDHQQTVIVTGSHWLTLQFIFAKEQTPQVFILDAMGRQGLKENRELAELIKSIMPAVSVLQNETKLQRSNNACHVFAIKLAQQLAHFKGVIITPLSVPEVGGIQLGRLAIELTSTQEFLTRWYETYGDEERAIGRDIVTKHTVWNEAIHKNINAKITETLSKTAEHNRHYLLTTPPETIQKAMYSLAFHSADAVAAATSGKEHTL